MGPVLAAPGPAAIPEIDAWLDEKLPALVTLRETLHAHPELSHCEKETSAFVARELRNLSFEVTEGVGTYADPDRTAYGVVAFLKNGEGPTVLLRTDLDALPIEEKTGLPFASRVKVPDAHGVEVGVMHACGHDVHMTVFLGTAAYLAEHKDAWQGTLLLVGQPAEETGTGARALLEGGLYERFPRPDFAIALHVHPTLEAGQVGFCPGYSMAGVDSVDIQIRGRGGHGALPQETIDPVVIAARTVLSLQTIASREVSPLDPVVVTVGSIHGGSKHNIIPDEVTLQLTVRTYAAGVRAKVLSAIRRIPRGEALAAGVPEDLLPVVSVDERESTPANYNDPELTARLRRAWEKALGRENVISVDPLMAGEDFARYSLEDHRIPACLYWLGSADPAEAARSRSRGVPLPSLHSPHYAPCAGPAIRTGVKAMAAAALEALQ
jgi:hippurate hydrolase